MIFGYAIEFLIQTVFLALALWIMIKLQKLDYNFPGLLGTAALTSLVSTILDPLIGVYFSTPVILAVLAVCVARLTRADSVDVSFTVFVGLALVFGMNLFLLGALMGDLRPSARNSAVEEEIALEEMEDPAEETAPAIAQPENKIAAATNQSATAAKPAAKREEPAKTVSRPAAKPKEPSFATPEEVEFVKKFTLKSVTKNAQNSSAIVHSGVKTYTIFLGESVSMQIAGGGSVGVRCDHIDENSVILTMEGVSVQLTL